MKSLQRPVVAVAAALALVSAVAVPLVASAPARAADPRLTVSPDSSSSTGSFRVVVRGQDYLRPPVTGDQEVPGGVYVFFGWVKQGSAWGPSAGGSFGATYVYPGEQGDGGTRTGDGSTQFVSFTDGGTSGDATPYHMDDDGDWQVTLTVPGRTFEYVDAAGDFHTVDCRTRTCGVFTIGAHGKVSPTNEKFTPIDFSATVKPSKSPTATPRSSPTSKPTRSATSRPTDSASSTPRPTTPAPSPTRTPAASRSVAAPVPSASPSSAPPGPTSSAPTTTASAGALAAPSGADPGGGSAIPWLVTLGLLAAAGGAVAVAVRRRAHRPA